MVSMARGRVVAFDTIVTLTDLLPPRFRYGYVHRVTARLLRRDLPTIPIPPTDHSDALATLDVSASSMMRSTPEVAFTVALVTDDLEVGGIGAVLEVLAVGFLARGVRVILVAGRSDGRRAARLRARGVEVHPAGEAADIVSVLAVADVIELHSASAQVEDAVRETAARYDTAIVTAMHNTEIHFSPERWERFGELVSISAAGIAVSETVRQFHARHVSPGASRKFVVVPNGSPMLHTHDPTHRADARDALARTIDASLREETVVFVCAARYDSQKNVAGTVASFLHALENGLEDAHLVFAGTPSDWAELMRADAMKRLSRHADRVHLIGSSDVVQLLLAADAFLLNSFFEGWPMAANEAAAAGLPLIISEVGGAAELTSALPDRSVLVPNALGDASAVSDSAVRRARRQSHAQANRDDLARALRHVADLVRADRSRPVPEAIRRSEQDMVRGHLDVLRDALPHPHSEGRQS